MIPSILTVLGPNKMAPSPVPVIWEQLPVTDGILSEEITNTKAPDIARSSSAFLFCFKIFCMEKNPAIRNGRQTTPHATHHDGGRYPSIMCIALETGATENSTANAILAFHNRFCFFVICVLFLSFDKFADSVSIP